MKNYIMKELVMHLNFLANNELLDTTRKTDQGYGFAQGLITILSDNFFNDVSECYQLWNCAVHPAYKTTIEEWREKYNEYF